MENLNEKGLLDDFELESSVKIYSSNAIMGFSFFFSPIFGAVLLMQNLNDIERRKEANVILVQSIAYTILVLFISSLLQKPNTAITFGLNTLGGVALTKYYFKKYFPDEALHPKKKIWKPLIISIIIITPFVFAAIYNATHQ